MDVRTGLLIEAQRVACALGWRLKEMTIRRSSRRDVLVIDSVEVFEVVQRALGMKRGKKQWRVEANWLAEIPSPAQSAVP